MKANIIVNAFFDTPATRYQSSRIKEELERRKISTYIIKNDLFGAEIDGGKLKECMDCDFVVYLDKDKYLSLALEKSGVKLFNSHSAIQACDDKALCAINLANCGVPMPRTIPGLLCYDQSSPLSPEYADYIESRLGYPLVVKRCFGSLGKFVYRADDRKALESFMEELKCTPHLYQQYIEESAGRDVRVTVVGGRAIAAMERKSCGDFRSNIGLGGKGAKYELDGELRNLCERAANILKLDYCGIDVLFGKDGYLLCEVNSNAFFGGSESATGVNIAGEFVEHILNTLSK